MSDTTIRFLPEHLSVVPPGPRGADDPEAENRRLAYLRWRDAVYRYRVERHHLIAHTPNLIPLEKHYCAEDFGYWLTLYGTIFEPRPDRNALGGGDLPFLPFAKQLDLIAWMGWVLTQKGANADGVVSKTRDVGASWMVCAYALWGWLFKHPWDALLISRKEDLVDSKNQASLFAKIDRLFWGLPVWMRPQGFDPDRHRQKLFLLNPENLNELSGESTTSKSGRGSRATWVAFDEAAFIPELFNTWNGIASTTSHRFAISTESLDDGPDFYNLRTGTDMDFRPALFELDWFDNPLNDDPWFDNEKMRMASRPADFAREILRNPHMSSSLVYGQFHDPKYAPDPNRNAVDPAAPTYVTIDPGKLDETAIVVLQENTHTMETVILDAYQNKGKDADFYGTLLSGEPDEDKFPGMYGDREHDFMELLKQLPAPTYTGDVYGDTSNGVTLDTFYGVLGAYENPQGERILVNRDRLGNKDKGMYRRHRSTFKGRQQCVHELSHGMRFSARPGAVFAHRCLTSHRYKPPTAGTITEPSAPIHDWSSHVVQAIEFWAVYKKTRSELLGIAEKPKPLTAGPKRVATLARLQTPGAVRQRATLYRSPR